MKKFSDNFPRVFFSHLKRPKKKKYKLWCRAKVARLVVGLYGPTNLIDSFIVRFNLTILRFISSTKDDNNKKLYLQLYFCKNIYNLLKNVAKKRLIKDRTPYKNINQFDIENKIRYVGNNYLCQEDTLYNL